MPHLEQLRQHALRHEAPRPDFHRSVDISPRERDHRAVLHFQIDQIQKFRRDSLPGEFIGHEAF
jgi:hypothetical protein